MRALLLSCWIILTGYAGFTQPGISSSPWKDTKGKSINAHGGGILFHNEVYYWFGEIKKGTTWRVDYVKDWEDYRVKAGGVSCYSSRDLVNWKYEGVALRADTSDSRHDLHSSKVIERPKVIYNSSTKKFVMWMHVDKEDYSYSQSGVAVSDKPQGPYHYLGSVQPNRQMSRDMTLFKDDDNRAYLIYSSENNNTMQVCLLADDYLSPTPNYKRILVDKKREAPTMFKYDGKYYLVSSGCTGWSPNAALYAVASHPLGDWVIKDNPCIGPDAETTFQSQSTYVLPVQGKKNAFIFLADIWNKTDLENSKYLWLPLYVNEEGVPVISYIHNWNITEHE